MIGNKPLAQRILLSRLRAHLQTRGLEVLRKIRLADESGNVDLIQQLVFEWNALNLEWCRLRWKTSNGDNLRP